jgi:hypothetical protein
MRTPSRYRIRTTFLVAVPATPFFFGVIDTVQRPLESLSAQVTVFFLRLATHLPFFSFAGFFAAAFEVSGEAVIE